MFFIMEGTKISFRVSDPDVAKALNYKKKNNEMSAYINEALRFYLDNASQLSEIKQTVAEIKAMLENGVMVNSEPSNTGQKLDTVDEVDQVFMESLDAFF